MGSRLTRRQAYTKFRRLGCSFLRNYCSLLTGFLGVSGYLAFWIYALGLSSVARLLLRQHSGALVRMRRAMAAPKVAGKDLGERCIDGRFSGHFAVAAYRLSVLFLKMNCLHYLWRLTSPHRLP